MHLKHMLPPPDFSDFLPSRFFSFHTLASCSHAVDRRKRFILSFAGAVGLGISLKPDVFTNHLWLISDSAPTGIQMLQQSVSGFQQPAGIAMES